MFKFILPVLIILFLTADLFSLSPHPYPQSIELFYNYESSAILEDSLNLEKGNLPEETSLQYQLLCESEYHLLMGISYLREEEKRAAKQYLKRAYEVSLKAFEIEESLNSYNQLAVSMVYYGLAQGVGGIISSAGKANEYIEKILEMDPSYPDGLIMKSQRLIFAPRAFGGNPLEAIGILEYNHRQLDSLSKPQQFETLMALSQAHGRLGNLEEALEYAEKAKSYYPGNKDLQDWLEDLSKS